MPFDASLPDEIAPGEGAAFRCKYWNEAIESRCSRIYDHGGIHAYELTNKEPPGSAGSSPDDFCGRCKHHRRYHGADLCTVCPAFTADNEHDFVPAEPEAPTAAQEAAMDELTHLRQEMEATEPEACYCGCAPLAHKDHNNGCKKHGVHEFIRKSFAPDESLPEPEAPECGALDNERCCPMGCQVKAAEREQNRLELQAMEPPRRPPYAVAYVLQDGTHFEVALPGDATVCALDGALLITHTQSPIQGLTQARPMEG
jgi:hypothetical protein